MLVLILSKWLNQSTSQNAGNFLIPFFRYSNEGCQAPYGRIPNFSSGMCAQDQVLQEWQKSFKKKAAL